MLDRPAGSVTVEVSAECEAEAALASTAAELEVRHRLGLGDSFAAALAHATGAPLLTGDVDLLALEGGGLAIEWVGKRP